MQIEQNNSNSLGFFGHGGLVNKTKVVLKEIALEHILPGCTCFLYFTGR